MRLIVDCGATSTDWCLLEEGGARTVRTAGFNLAHTPAACLKPILDDAAAQLGPGIDHVYFYAAGLVGESPVDLTNWFPGAKVEYASDMLGAARAVCGRERGIAAILGTGANTCQYGGSGIERQIPCGGFIIGDEGSASVLGRLFVTDYLKNQVPEALAKAFAEQFEADYKSIVRQVYSGSAPARWLGSIAPFLLKHYKASEYVRRLMDGNFCSFIERTLRQYDPLPVGVVGGFGYACQDILQRLGALYGITFNRFMASPLDGLVAYHAV